MHLLEGSEERVNCGSSKLLMRAPFFSGVSFEDLRGYLAKSDLHNMFGQILAPWGSSGLGMRGTIHRIRSNRSLGPTVGLYLTQVTHVMSTRDTTRCACYLSAKVDRTSWLVGYFPPSNCYCEMVWVRMY